MVVAIGKMPLKTNKEMNFSNFNQIFILYLKSKSIFPCSIYQKNLYLCLLSFFSSTKLFSRFVSNLNLFLFIFLSLHSMTDFVIVLMMRIWNAFVSKTRRNMFRWCRQSNLVTWLTRDSPGWLNWKKRNMNWKNSRRRLPLIVPVVVCKSTSASSAVGAGTENAHASPASAIANKSQQIQFILFYLHIKNTTKNI